MGKYDGLERREWGRVVKEVVLEYRAPNGVSLDYLSDFEEATLANVGGGGVCFETSTFVPTNTVIEFQFGKTTRRGRKAVSPVQASGKVMWIRQIAPGKYRLGLQFLGLEQGRGEELLKEIGKGASKRNARGGKKNGSSS